MENKLGRSVVIIFFSLFIAVFGVIPEVNFAIRCAAHQDLLLSRVPFKHSDLLVMELHLVEVVSWHAGVKHRDDQILS